MANTIPFPIKSVTVVIDKHGTDAIFIELEGPTLFPELKYSLRMKAEARYGFGVEWVKTNLGIEPEVVKMN